jgi:putative ABC transport system permease protein
VSAALHLVWRRTRAEPGVPLLLAASLCLALFLPLATRSLVERLESALLARASATPLIAGAAGSRLDLVLSGLYFRAVPLEPVSAELWDRLAAEASGVAVPLAVGATLRGAPLVGTSPEYAELRGLRCVRGEWPLWPGEVVLGHSLAAEVGLGPGDEVFTDPAGLYDLSVPQALVLRVCGTLAPSGGPDDRAAFCDLLTTWAVAGLAHGHADAEALGDRELVLGEVDGNRVLSPALRTENRIEARDLASFHLHGSRDQLPLAAVLYFPDDERARTVVRARYDLEAGLQMVAPRAVVEELLAAVFRVQRLLDLFAAALAASTLVLGALILWLSTRLRAAELKTLDRLGASRRFTLRLLGTEVLLLVLAAGGAAALGLWLLGVVLPEPDRWL